MFLDQGDYSSYCLNQAVAYFGLFIDSEMEKAEELLNRGKKSPKPEAVARARTNVLIKYGIKSADTPRAFADPAAMFG